MGKYNSSKYRVVPLVEVIKNDAYSFERFLETVTNLPGLSFPLNAESFYYGDNEKKLKPPKEHLEALIDYLATKKHNPVSNLSRKRKVLFGLDPEADREEARKEAKRLLEISYIDDEQILPKEWYIFEGATNPDIYIEGEDYVIICEGKWTEPHITTKTTNLAADNEYRNQMVRHIQGALNYTNKKVYAFYIVDKGCGYEADLSTDAFAAQLEKETIEIPGKEKEEIIRAFYGYTTWQDIKNVLPAVDFKTKAEIG